jgi:hypothetical protein
MAIGLKKDSRTQGLRDSKEKTMKRTRESVESAEVTTLQLKKNKEVELISPSLQTLLMTVRVMIVILCLTCYQSIGGGFILDKK